MPFRDRISRVIHHNSESKFLQYDTKGPKFNDRDQNVGLALKNSADLVSIEFPGPNPQEDDDKFFELSKNGEDSPSRLGTLSKTFPEVPLEFRVSSGNPESRLSIPSGTRNTQRLAGNVGCSRTARCFRIVKISCVGQGIHLVLQILHLSQELTHRRTILFLLHREFIDFQVSGSICFFAADPS